MCYRSHPMKLLALFLLILAAAALTGQCDRATDFKRPPAVNAGPREAPPVPDAAPLPVTLRDVFFPR